MSVRCSHPPFASRAGNIIGIIAHCSTTRTFSVGLKRLVKSVNKHCRKRITIILPFHDGHITSPPKWLSQTHLRFIH